ncbi:Uncharacterised protein [Bordetella pertussis]|nr:Uncharacterised protein [Bordetella pertussis]
MAAASSVTPSSGAAAQGDSGACRTWAGGCRRAGSSPASAATVSVSPGSSATPVCSGFQ